ncbi:MAG: hypothetical protein H0W62_08550 [Chitinophagales bacterium]|nr:hypothetical protein [Chitinophagales bacterium]
MKFYRTDHWLPVCFFSVVLLTGIAVHGDYGVCWDDPTQHNLGLVTWDYIFGKSDALLSNENCYINPIVAAVEVIPEKIFNPKGEALPNSMRHLSNFIICWAGLIIFYLLGLRLFIDYRFSLVVCLFFLLTPRLFAHCFYNSKDLPFLFLFVLSVYALIVWVQRPSWQAVVWIIICSGLLTATRVAGVFFPVIVLAASAYMALEKKLQWREAKMIASYFLLFPLSVYAFFPSIWHDPIHKIAQVMALYSHHPYDVTTYFMGETIHSLNTPWYYIPVWMAITIPVAWWLFSLAGIILCVYKILIKKNQLSVSWLVVILWLVVPLGSAMAFHVNTYEDGRHLYFVEPALLLIAVATLKKIYTTAFLSAIYAQIVKAITGALLIATIICQCIFIVQSHPYQYAYFNLIGRKYANDYFDKDYWGISYRNALEFLVKYDHQDTINVQWKVDPCEWNLIWLRENDRRRLHVVPYEQCDYYITNFRSHKPSDASSEKIYEVKVQGATIMAVYKMHPPNILFNVAP